MNNRFRHDFPNLGVEIDIPEDLTVRQYNPPPMETLNMGSGKFSPFRMVIDFDVFDRKQGDYGKRVKTPVILRVYFTKAEFDLAEEQLKLAFWNVKLDPPDWEDLQNQNTILFGQSQWTGLGISYFGYIEATHPNWGDPPIALGK